MKAVEASAQLMAVGSLRAASGDSMLPAVLPTQDVNRPIHMPDGTLFGWIRQIANGETQLVLSKGLLETGF